MWNADQSLTVIDEIVAATFVSHSAPTGIATWPCGRQKVGECVSKCVSRPLVAGEDVIVEGDRVVERFRGGGTHQGELFGIPVFKGIVYTTFGRLAFRIPWAILFANVAQIS